MKRQKGFTLIELLVVISIIGILTAIGIASFTRAQRKARDARRIADLEAIEDALQLYYSDFNAYPASGWTNFDIAIVNVGGNVYMKRTPTDPATGWSQYQYRSSTVGNQCYCLQADLELLAAADNGCAGDGVTLTGTYDYGVPCP